MERRPTRVRTRLAVSVLALTLIVPWALGQDPAAIMETRRLADQDVSEAQYNLGDMYRVGRGVLKDDAEAVRWYRLAAEHENAGAQISLRAMYAEGRGVRKYDAEAGRWFLLAAEQGDAVAQFNLGRMYAEGRGVVKDDAEAGTLVPIGGRAGCCHCANQPRAHVCRGAGYCQGRCAKRGARTVWRPSKAMPLRRWTSG